ncbi:hypothetical protein CIB84_013106 [Bambusicola thoracicus]|uniref:Uncharacterized protein n=1 Tax=Bambusicola thoracicus TaxID=9083 RepID=A0A2P4SG99_BAMTH|nr:hypothetical protein CIB84_013106 [Bambusicola thoracicus]
MSASSLAGQAPPAREAAAQARDAKATRGDGHSLLTQDAANSSRGAGAHSGVLGEGAEDWSRQGHHHGGGLDHHPGVLALAHTGLVAAVGQRGRATGTAQIVAGHGGGMEVDLERGQTKHTQHEQLAGSLLIKGGGAGWVAGTGTAGMEKVLAVQIPNSPHRVSPRPSSIPPPPHWQSEQSWWEHHQGARLTPKPAQAGKGSGEARRGREVKRRARRRLLQLTLFTKEEKAREVNEGA